MSRWLVLLAVLALGAVLFVRWRYQVTREVSPYELAVRSIDENAKEGRRIGATPVFIGSLRALMRPPSEGASWFLYWGGNTSTYFQESVDTLERLDLPPAVGVLIVAPPGYDGSAGHPEPEGVLAAARLARDWLVRERRAERVVTGGFSMGALSALIAAEDPHVVATVLLASFTVFETGDPSRLIRFLEPVRYFPPSSMPKVKALVLHGEKDDGFAPQMGRDVATALGAEFVLVPDCGHVALQRNAVALARAKNFILGALSGP